MSIDYAKKIAELDFMYDIGLQRSEYKKVIAKCSMQKINYGSDDEWVAVVDSILADIRSDPQKWEIQKQARALCEICPVCGGPVEPITLMRGRKAFYCKQHRAVTPAIVTEN